jgi:hypothetical protein
MWDRMGIEQHVNEWIRIRIRNGGGGGRGDAIILTLYVRVGLLGLESAAGVDRLPLSWVATREVVSKQWKQQLFLLKFILYICPHRTILYVFPHSPPPPPPLQTPDWDVKWSECGYTVSGYSIFKNTRARAGVTHGPPWPLPHPRIYKWGIIF